MSKRPKPDEGDYNLDDVRREYRADYMAGRKQHEDGQPGIVPKSITGARRIATYLGWYDNFMFKRWGSPWPGPEGV